MIAAQPAGPTRARQSVAALAAGAAAVLALAGPARGQEGPCPPTCPGTGHQIYANVSFVGIPGQDIYRLSPPFFLDRALGDANGSARGIVDLASGTLRAGAKSEGLAGAGIIVQGVDEFTVGGVAPGTPVLVTARLVATGSGLIQSPFASMQSMIQLGFPGGANDFDLLTFQAPGNVPLNTLFPILMTAGLDFTVPSGTPFLFGYFLRLQSGNGAGSHLDFLNSAHLAFDLPSGATITSAGGYAAVPTAVPEPATLALVVVGLFAAAALGRRRAPPPRHAPRDAAA